MSTPTWPMSTPTVETLLPAESVKSDLQQAVGRPLPKETVRRWRRAVGVELVVRDGKHYYTQRDAYKVAFVARYLQRVERNLANAVIQLFEELDNVPN